MAEGYSIDFGKFVLGCCKTYTSYGKCKTKDGTIYQVWKFYIWIKEGDMTNEQLTAAFPECERIKKEQVAPFVEQVFNEVESWRQISYKIKQLCQQLWPEPEYVKWKDPQYLEWYQYFYGDFDSHQRDFDRWTDLLENVYLQRTGERHTMDEACQIAADEWVRMIFGNHIQYNGDRSDMGGMIMMLGTLAKDKAKRGISSEVIEKFRKLCKEYYLGGCRFKDDKYRQIESVPYCDYEPNSALERLLEQAGVPNDSIGGICPWKTGIIIDERDHAVIVMGYQTERYI